MSDLPDEDEDDDREPPARRTSPVVRAVVVLLLVLVLVDVFAIQFLGQPANRTFSHVGPVTKGTTGR